MILRGAFWAGLVWFCASQGPDLGLFAPAAAAPCCGGPVQDAGDAWRQDVLRHLAAMRSDLKLAIARRGGRLS